MVVGSRIESVNKIAAVELVESHLDAIQMRFMARATRDPEGVGNLIFTAGKGTSGMLETNMMAKGLEGVEGPRVE